MAWCCPASPLPWRWYALCSATPLSAGLDMAPIIGITMATTINTAAEKEGEKRTGSVIAVTKEKPERTDSVNLIKENEYSRFPDGYAVSSIWVVKVVFQRIPHSLYREPTETGACIQAGWTGKGRERPEGRDKYDKMEHESRAITGQSWCDSVLYSRQSTHLCQNLARRGKEHRHANVTCRKRQSTVCFVVQRPQGKHLEMNAKVTSAACPPLTRYLYCLFRFLLLFIPPFFFFFSRPFLSFPSVFGPGFSTCDCFRSPVSPSRRAVAVSKQ